MSEFLSFTARSDAAEIAAYFDAASVNAALQCRIITTLAVNRIKSEIQAEMHEGGSGTHWPNLPYPSSAPGQAPARQTGNYSDSWDTIVVQDSDGSTTGIAGTDAVQAQVLEYGFVGIDKAGRQHNQAPRPHFGPAVDKWVPWWADQIGQASLPS